MRLITAGHGRSGTTPMQHVLNGCPDLWITNEFCLYDYAFGYNGKAVSWELENHYNPDAPSYYGHCDGWAVASILESEPQESVTINNTTFFIGDMKELGYLPEGVVNWMALIGWSYDDHTEFFTLADLIEKFSIEKLNPSPAAINFSKLDHFNGLHIRNLELSDLAQRMLPFFEKAGIKADLETLEKIAAILQVRMVTLDEAVEKAGFFFQDEVHPKLEDLIAKKLTATESAEVARKAYDLLSGLPEITHESAEQPMRDLAAEMDVKVGQLFSIVRVAVTGQRVSPPLFESMEIIGREKSLERLQKAIMILENQSNIV